MFKPAKLFLLVICFILTGASALVFAQPQRQEILSAEIGPDGGSLSGYDQVTNKWIVVRFPPNAVNNKTRFELVVAKNTVKAKMGEPSPVAFNISPEINFEQPVEVDIEYGINNKVSPDAVLPVPYFVDELGKLHLVTIKSLNQKDQVFTMLTFHGGKYIWILDYGLTGK